MKNIQFKQLFATIFRHLTQKIMVLVYLSMFSTYLTVFAPIEYIFVLSYSLFENHVLNSLKLLKLLQLPNVGSRDFVTFKFI